MPTAYLALGANLGDRRRNIEAAVGMLRATARVRVKKVSSLLETAAVGGPNDSPRFLNGVAEIETELCPTELLSRLLEIERHLGRQRRQKWDPRLIDLDILLYNDRIINEPNLKVPHPLMHRRGFVLQPLAEIAPDRIHPALGISIRQMLKRLREKEAGDKGASGTDS